MDDLESFSVKDSDFEFLNDKYWLIRSLYAERGITLPVEPLASDEEEDFFKNLSLNGQNGVNGHNGQNGHKSNGVANGRSEVLERLEELEALQRMERTELDVKKSSLSLPMPGTVVRPRPTLSRAMLNKLNDIDTRTFTRAKRSPVHPNRTFGNHFEHNISEDLLNISEADIEADMNRIMGSSLFSSDAFALDSPLKNNQSFIITKANDISTDMLNVTPDPNQHANELMNATFTNNIDNGISPGFANNYDDVQEIARKQEEALRKKSNLLRNNTIIKTRRERVAGDLDTTIVMDKEGSEASDKVDFNSTFSKAELQPCLISPETMLSLDSPGNSCIQSL